MTYKNDHNEVRPSTLHVGDVGCTLWCQFEDMFQLIGTSQGIERVLFQIIVTPEYFEKYRVKYKA